MALTAEQTAKAQAEAREFLEYSILVLCSALGVSVSGLGDTYEVPVPEGDEYYEAHVALSRQVAALALLP
jgi:hypothetical protein